MPYPAKLHPEQILEAARHLTETAGLDELSMRNLAAALNVRASSLYRHYPGREAVLRALADQAAQALQADLAAVRRPEQPRQALLDAAQVYLHFARARPHLYALLLLKNPDLTPQELAASAGKHLWNTILALVGDLSGHPDDTDQAVAYWTFLHGFAALERSGTFGPSGPKGGLQVGLNALLDHMAGPSSAS